MASLGKLLELIDPSSSEGMTLDEQRGLLGDLAAGGVAVTSPEQQWADLAKAREVSALAAADAEMRRRAENPDPTIRERIGNLSYDAAIGLGAEPTEAEAVRGGTEFSTDFVPVVGDAVGAEETYEDYKAGRYVPMAIGGLATMAGLVPMAGPALSKGIKKGGKYLTDIPEVAAKADDLEIPAFLRRGADNEFVEMIDTRKPDTRPFSKERPPMIAHINMSPDHLDTYKLLDYNIPSPSGAVSNAYDPLQGFGDVSFYFDKGSIDPRYRPITTTALVEEGVVEPAEDFVDYQIKLEKVYESRGMDPHLVVGGTLNRGVKPRRGYSKQTAIYPDAKMEVSSRQRPVFYPKGWDPYFSDGTRKSESMLPDFNLKNVREYMDQKEAWMPATEGAGGAKEFSASVMQPFNSIEEMQKYRDAGRMKGWTMDTAEFNESDMWREELIGEMMERMGDTDYQTQRNVQDYIIDRGLEETAGDAGRAHRRWKHAPHLEGPLKEAFESPSLQDIYKKYKETINDAPSDYMEWKPKDNFDLRQAKAVSIPEDLDFQYGKGSEAKLRKHLTELGIEDHQIFKMKSPQERHKITRKLTNLHFAVGGGIGALLAMPEVVEYLESDQEKPPANLIEEIKA